MGDFRVHILGCGSALPTTVHYPTSQVVEFRDKLFLVDCGEGAQRQFRLQHLDFGRIVGVLISHLHGDHCYGLPGFLSTLGMLGRRRALPIYGPRGIDRFLAPFIEESSSYLGYDIEVHVLNDRESTCFYEDRSLTITSLPLEHRIPCTGYLFREKVTARHIDRPACDFYGIPMSFYPALRDGQSFKTADGKEIPADRLTKPGRKPRSYAYCSDTAYAPHLIPLIRQVTLLYHEATFPRARQARAKQTAHSTAEEAALIAKQAEVERLLIGHYSARYSDATPLLQEALEVFPTTIASDEGMTLDL